MPRLVSVALALAFCLAASPTWAGWNELATSAGLDASRITFAEGAAADVRATGKTISVRNVEDLRAPKLQIVWEHAAEVPVFELPKDARVFARDRWEKAPLVAGWKRGAQAVLWTALPIGDLGYERFPYLPQGLLEMGATPRARSNRLWAFFDSSYRLRVDLDYFAPQWKKAGIAALHVAAWHYWERDAEGDKYLARLIDTCHRNGILVYAWFEFPHVSEKFWAEHPEWREKTALGQDARLDWRKLINLQNHEASAAVAKGFDEVMARFDWDGVNLGELYFESLEGAANPARFTPFNDDVRREFQAATGAEAKPSDPRFLEYRAELARKVQAEWLGRADSLRAKKPNLDVVLTHVDDRFDATMREKIGADTSRTLPLLKERDFTFLVEDPATIWNLGPSRYREIASRYLPATPRPEKLAIDINVAERYQDVYPTKQQTGGELFALVHQAALSFPRVALYFESSISKLDWPLLATSAAPLTRYERSSARLEVESPRGVGVAWGGPALVDGKAWPFYDGSIVWLPSGLHRIEPSLKQVALPIRDFTGEISSARVGAAGIEFEYRSSARALATLERPPKRLEIDGEEALAVLWGSVIVLPRGQHLVRIE